MGYRTIMVGTDGSDTAVLAVRAVTRLAKRFGAVVHIVCAHGDGVDEQSAVEVLRYARESVRAEGVETKTHMRVGPAPAAIKELAARHGVDLIVVGDRGRSKFARLLLGSVSKQVVQYAGRPVLVVR